MATFGVTPQGFNKMRLSDIKLEIENSLRSTFGNQLNLLPESFLSNLTGIFSDRESSLWELAEQIYNAKNRDTAEGVQLDDLYALVNVSRLGSAKSVQSDLHLFGSPGALIDAGLQVSVQGSTASKFKTASSVVLAAGADEVQTLTFSATPDAGTFRLMFINETTLPIAFNALAADVQAALNAISKLGAVVVTGSFAAGFVITFAGINGKIDQPLLVVTDKSLTNTAVAVTTTVVETTKGISQGKVNVTAVDDGAIVAPAYSLTVIDTPVSGLDRVLNITDATVGRAVEADPNYRVRGRTAQKANGSGTTEAIRARILGEVTGVTQCIVFENPSKTVDVNGLPASSIRAYVQGGADQEILNKIWEVKGGGIEPDGLISGTVIDSQGISRTMKFSRPTVIGVYIKIEITKNAKFPADGAAQVRAALAAYVNGLNIGESVIVYPALIASLNSISGIVDIRLGIATTPAPAYGTDANIAVGISEVAKIIAPDTDIIVAVV